MVSVQHSAQLHPEFSQVLGASQVLHHATPKERDVL
jgi:hypothetical protein